MKKLKLFGLPRKILFCENLCQPRANFKQGTHNIKTRKKTIFLIRITLVMHGSFLEKKINKLF